ncbi:hypothetical protein SDC9_195020 [bioreactor metagenome]|uniref:Phosphohistidine phosphatase SixA n=1 Tax=bioreactor metagenome TaxID=1076179 RepID=A0A645I833_9ZZZZ
MKTLILQRHAKAEKDGDEDLLRTLTPIGISDAAAQGETIRQLEIFPELILHSPAQRARQTAEIMAAKLELSEGYTVEDAALYECDSCELIALLRNLPEDCDTVLVIAHNPAAEIAADSLGSAGIDHLRPSEAVILQFDTEDWREIGIRNCSASKFIAKPESV